MRVLTSCCFLLLLVSSASTQEHHPDDHADVNDLSPDSDCMDDCKATVCWQGMAEDNCNRRCSGKCNINYQSNEQVHDKHSYKNCARNCYGKDRRACKDGCAATHGTDFGPAMGGHGGYSGSTSPYKDCVKGCMQRMPVEETNLRLYKDSCKTECDAEINGKPDGELVGQGEDGNFNEEDGEVNEGLDLGPINRPFMAEAVIEQLGSITALALPVIDCITECMAPNKKARGRDKTAYRKACRDKCAAEDSNEESLALESHNAATYQKIVTENNGEPAPAEMQMRGKQGKVKTNKEDSSKESLALNFHNQEIVAENNGEPEIAEKQMRGKQGKVKAKKEKKEKKKKPKSRNRKGEKTFKNTSMQGNTFGGRSKGKYHRS